MELGPLELLVFQGTPFCNIDCSYCYLPDRLNKRRISQDVVRSTLINLVNENLIRGDFTVLWHAGEPLVMPIQFYEETFELIQNSIPPEFKVLHSFQSNGLLINKAWCEFFKKHQVDLGISIDGPEFIHDRNRKTRSGEGTFSKAIKATELIKEYEMELHFISVLTSFSCGYPETIYNFFKEIGAQSVAFNVEEVEGANTESSFTHLPTAEKMVADFLRTIYRLNLANGEPLKIREIDWAKSRLLHSNLNPDDIVFTQLTGPYRTITVDYEGNFSTFSPELIAQKKTIYGDFVLGNVLRDSFTTAASTSKFQHMYNDLVKGLAKCKSNCGYYGLCCGGTPSNKLSEQGTLDTDETQHCRLVFQTPIDTLLEMVGEEQKTVSNIY